MLPVQLPDGPSCSQLAHCVDLPVEEIAPAWEPIPPGPIHPGPAPPGDERAPTQSKARPQGETALLKPAGSAPGLAVPESIDQRFFVKSAAVFRKLLLETCTAE